MNHRMHGHFRKRIDDSEVEAFYDGFPLGISIKRPNDQKLRLHGIQEAKDLVYLLHALITEYENP